MSDDNERLRELEQENRALQRQIAGLKAQNSSLLVEKTFLENSTRQLNFLQNAQDGVYFTNARNEIIFANPYLMRILGYAEADDAAMLGQPLPDTVWDDLADREEIVAKMRDNGFIRDQQVVMRNLATRERVYISLSSILVRDDDGAAVGAQYMLCNVSSKMQVVEELRRRSRELALMQQMGRAVSTTLELANVTHSVVDCALAELEQPGWGWLYICTPAGLQLAAQASYQVGQSSSAASPIVLASEVMNTRQPLHRDANADPRVTALGGSDALVMPLLLGDDLVAVLTLLAVNGRFSNEDEQMLQSVQGQVAGAIRNAQRYTALCQALNQMQAAPSSS